MEKILEKLGLTIICMAFVAIVCLMAFGVYMEGVASGSKTYREGAIERGYGFNDARGMFHWKSPAPEKEQK